MAVDKKSQISSLERDSMFKPLWDAHLLLISFYTFGFDSVLNSAASSATLSDEDCSSSIDIL